jgi:hypothetical protein
MMTVHAEGEVSKLLIFIREPAQDPLELEGERENAEAP